MRQVWKRRWEEGWGGGREVVGRMVGEVMVGGGE
jgi:hypothetical protein